MIKKQNIKQNIKQYINKSIQLSELKKLAQDAKRKKYNLICCYAYSSNNNINNTKLYLNYIFKSPEHIFEIWKCELKKDINPPSLALVYPSVSWDEREIKDLFDIKFDKHPDDKSLVLHEGAKYKSPPMLTKKPKLLDFTPSDFQYPEIKNKELQYVMFGPICSSVKESIEFDFFHAGETTAHTYQKLFFKHRGMEKRFEGKSIEHGAVLSERVSGIGSSSHCLAYCQAIESASKCIVPEKAKLSRIIISELERLYNHLHYLGHLSKVTGLKVGVADGALLSELTKQINIKVTGDRLLRNILTPGGLRRELKLNNIKKDLENLQNKTSKYIKRLLKTKTHYDRIYGLAPLKQDLAIDMGATGPIARASGIKYDSRMHNSYAAYNDNDINFESACSESPKSCDGLSRQNIRMQEIETSFDLIFKCIYKIENLNNKNIKTKCEIKSNSYGLGWCESPRGTTFYSIHFDDKKKITRVKIHSASYSNWRVFPYTVQGGFIMDFLIVDATFGLSVAGCDR